VSPDVDGAQPGHRFVENLATRRQSLSRWSANLNLDDRDLVSAHSNMPVDATVRTVRHPVRKSQAGAPEDALVSNVRRIRKAVSRDIRVASGPGVFCWLMSQDFKRRYGPDAGKPPRPGMGRRRESPPTI
jgi:hypothetical protein